MDTQTIEVSRNAGMEYAEKGNPVGISLEEWMDMLDNRLIEHFGDDFRNRVNESRKRWNSTGRWHFDTLES
jgi:hypothetical protein